MLLKNIINEARHFAWDLTHDHTGAKGRDIESDSNSLWFDKDGNRVTSRVSKNDMDSGLPGLGWLILGPILIIAIMFLNGGEVTLSSFYSWQAIVSLLVISLLSIGSAFFIQPFSYSTLLLVSVPLAIISPVAAIAGFAGVVIGSLVEPLFNNLRISDNDRASAGESHVAQQRQSGAQVLARARQSQRVASQSDIDDIQIGLAIGDVKRFTGDEYAYSAGAQVILNVLDLIHSLIHGETGSGKTVNLIRSIALQWVLAALKRTKSNLKARMDGLLILCGKNALGFDFVGVPGHKMIHPDKDVLAPMQGLSAVRFCTILSGSEDTSGKKDYFDMAGESLLRQCAFMLEYQAHYATNADERKWCMMELYRLIESDELKVKARKEIAADLEFQRQQNTTFCQKNLQTTDSSGDVKQISSVYDMACIFIDSYVKTADAERGGVLNSAALYLRPFAECQEMMHWFNAYEGVDPTSVLRGEIVSVIIPDEYGRASSMFVNLIYGRVMQSAMARPDEDKWVDGDGHTRCMIVIDECQEIMDDNHVKNIAICRSRGIRMVYCTQSYDAIVDSLGSERAASTFLGNISSVMTLKSTEDTYKMMATKMGTVYRPVTKRSVYITANETEWNSRSAKGHSGYHDLREGVSKSKKLLGMHKQDDGLLSDDAGNLKLGGHGAIVEYDYLPAITAEEMSAMLNAQYTCVVALKRGGAMRRDHVDLADIGPAFTPAAFTQKLIDLGLMPEDDGADQDGTGSAAPSPVTPTSPTVKAKAIHRVCAMTDQQIKDLASRHTSPMEAAMAGNFESMFAQLILDHELVSLKTSDNANLLHVLAGSADAEIMSDVLSLMDDGTEYINERNGQAGLTPLLVTTIKDRDVRRIEKSKALIEAGSDVNLAETRRNRAPVHFAVIDNDLALFSELVNYNADIDSLSDDDGEQLDVLMLAEKYGRKKHVALISQSRAA